MQKTIFVFDAEDAIIVAKIDAGNASGMTCIHIADVWFLCSYTRTRLGVLPKSGIRTSIMSELLLRRAKVLNLASTCS